MEPVLGLSEALNSPQAKARQMVVDVDLPGEGKVRQMANPIMFSQASREYATVGVPSGTHTKEVLLGLGYSEEEYWKLEEEGIFS